MTKPAHILRPADRRPKPAKSAAPAVYPPGHFTELIRRHRWPPRFEPQCSLVSDALAGVHEAEVRMTAPETTDKRVATLQAQAALRGIEVDRLFDGTYVVRAYLAQRLIATTDEALTQLLARMGVSE